MTSGNELVIDQVLSAHNCDRTPEEYLFNPAVTLAKRLPNDITLIVTPEGRRIYLPTGFVSAPRTPAEIAEDLARMEAAAMRAAERQEAMNRAPAAGSASQVEASVETTEVGSVATNASSGLKSQRSENEIELEIDRNKGAVYALYSRALRDNPNLQGELILDLTISAAGEMVDCAVVSTTLNDTKLLDGIVARLKLIRFREAQVPPTTFRKTMQFYPG